MQKTAFALTLDGDGFNGMKADFNQIFNALIEKMIDQESENGTITIKLNITLKDGMAPDIDEVKYSADREIISPKFEHTITSTFQFRDKKAGFTGGDTYEMFWSRDDNCWVVQKISDAQRSLFDETEEADSDADAGAEAGETATEEDPDEKAADAMDSENDGGYEYEQPGTENDDDMPVGERDADTKDDPLMATDDPVVEDAIQYVRESGRATVGRLQSYFGLGYLKAAALMNALEARGVVGPPDESGTREVLPFETEGGGEGV